MLSQISRDAAREEVGRVLLAQEDLAFFAEYVSDGWYQAHEMHHLIAWKLQQVLRYIETRGAEGIGHLMILTPPQHGKSELVSRMFPAFALGKLPNLRVIEISYGADLASDSSRAVRNLLTSDRYQAVFGKLSPSSEPVRLASDSKAASAWDLAAPHRGGMIAAGNGGAVSGRARGLVLWDDPIKDHRAAQSQEVRDDAWDFYKSVLRVRSLATVLIMTHWHPDDPAGRIMRQMVQNPNADQWEIVALPGLMEEGMFAPSLEEQRKKMLEGIYLPLKDPLGRAPGDVLCAAMMNKAEMLKIKETSEDFFFSALYQQQPFTRDGQRYKREWFRVVTKLPDGVRIVHIVRYWDKANSTKGDYTAGVLMAYCSDGYFYILDVVRGRWTTYERDSMIKQTAVRDVERYGNVHIWHQQDPGSAGKDAAVATNRLLVGFNARFEPLSGDKEARSEPLESGFQGEMIFLLQGAWNDAFLEECIAFPRGKHDDQVDAASTAYNKLCEMVSGQTDRQAASAPAVVTDAESLFL